MSNVPAWFDDPEEIAPCPCGNPPEDGCLVISGSNDLKRWFHPECLDFLDHELDEDELEEKREWERMMREQHGYPDDNDIDPRDE